MCESGFKILHFSFCRNNQSKYKLTFRFPKVITCFNIIISCIFALYFEHKTIDVYSCHISLICKHNLTYSFIEFQPKRNNLVNTIPLQFNQWKLSFKFIIYGKPTTGGQSGIITFSTTNENGVVLQNLFTIRDSQKSMKIFIVQHNSDQKVTFYTHNLLYALFSMT